MPSEPERPLTILKHGDPLQDTQPAREEDLRLRLAELEHIYRDAPVGLCFVDRDLRYVRINEHLAAINGRSVAEHVGRTIRDILPEVAESIEAVYQRVLQSGEPVLDFTLQGVTPAEPGIERDWLSSYFPIKAADGTVLGVSAAVMEVTEHKRAERKAMEYAERLQTLSVRLREVQEAERQHLARELHDEIGQQLTGLRLLLKTNSELPFDLVMTRFGQAQAIVDQLLDRVRTLSFDLRPAVLDELGLLPALLALFERYTERTGVLVNFKHQGLEDRFAPEVETAAYRIVQEALTNVARHAEVAGGTVRVWATPDLLNVQIEDRGRGFDPDLARAKPRSSGLVGMEERAILLGGQLTIESHPGAGTQITAELPIRPRKGAQ